MEKELGMDPTTVGAGIGGSVLGSATVSFLAKYWLRRVEEDIQEANRVAAEAKAEAMNAAEQARQVAAQMAVELKALHEKVDGTATQIKDVSTMISTRLDAMQVGQNTFQLRVSENIGELKGRLDRRGRVEDAKA